MAMASPSDAEIRAAEELELGIGDDSFEEVSVNDTPKSSTSPRRESPASDEATKKSPNKVKAAAARWETATTSTSASSASLATPDRPKLSPSSSFRSIPASSSKSSLPPRHSPRPTQAAHIGSPTPSRLQLEDADLTTPKLGGNRESFAEVQLDDPAFEQDLPVPIGEAKSYSLSPIPPPADMTSVLPEPVLTPPANDPPPAAKSFFSTALGFGIPTSQNSGILTAEPASSPLPSRSASSSSTGASGWRSTMSNLLGKTSASSTPSAPASATVPSPALPSALRSPLTEASRSSSTSFLLHRMASPTASRDRRISREVGATDKLREGFERVRVEMEGAAREMRREEQKVGSPASSETAGGVDWAFWGAVVQDYEDVARTRPKDLSKAIQQGVPAVIRGAIWQLMSSSKSAPLEETYKALLKLPSPHEKAIAKDLSRTFPNHKYFQEGGGLGQESLYMVVKAYSLYDQEVGCTQGLAFIVAALLLNMPDEEAFCVLVRLMDSYNLRSHFLADMPGLQLRLFQFDRLIEEILPHLHAVLLKKGVKSSMYASQWFMTLFSYRFPLSLVYRVLDIVFAEGIEAIFRFSIALLKKSEDKLVGMEFEQILAFLQTDLFEDYRVVPDEGEPESQEKVEEEEEWKANDFVRDAYEIRITPFMLDSYESEYEEQCRAQNKHALELDQLRNANRNLSAQVKQLESSLAIINEEHVELVRQLVMSKIEKEETENELVRYKMLYAELAHAQQDALSTHSRFSAGSSMSQMQNLETGQ